MSGYLERFVSILKGKLGRTLDDLEDPEAQLSLLVEELNNQVSELRKAVAIPMAQEKRLRLEIEDRLAKANEWNQRAILALDQGDEDLARQALIKKEEIEENAVALQGDWETQRAAADRLKADLEAAKKRVSEAKSSFALVVARHKSALVKKSIADKTSAGADDSAAQLMERLNEKILRIEAETEAQLEMSGESLGDDLEGKFLELERKKKGDRALNELKASLAAEGSAAVDAGAGTRSRVDELKAKLRG